MKTAIKVDRKWFERLVAARNIKSHAEVARRIGKSPAFLSLVLKGERELSVDDVRNLAQLLGVGISDITAHFGGSVREAVLAASEDKGGNSNSSPPSTSALDIVGWIDAYAVVHMDDGKRRGGLALPFPVPDGAKALQYRTAKTTADQFDRWNVIIMPRQRPDASEIIGRYGIIKVKGGETHFRVVRSGEKAGRFTLTATNLPPIYDAQIEWYCQVLSIQPPTIPLA